LSNIILGSDGIAIKQGIYEESSVAKTDLGRFIEFQDGRKFRYCQADGAITKGHVAAGGAVVANDNTVTQTGMTVAISGGHIGAKVVKVLLAAATTANLYAGGLLTVEGGTGLGQCHRIKSNKAGGASVASPCELTLYDPLVVALDETSIITLTKNKYKDVIVAPAATDVAPLVCVPLISITDNYYFWGQVKGYAPIVVDDSATLTIGETVSIGATDAGSVTGATDAHSEYQQVGKVVQIAAADTYATIDLMLE